MKVYILFLLVLFVLSLMIIIICSNTIIKVKKVIINDDKIDKDINIVFVSDFHVGKNLKKKELKKIIDLINKIDGDFLLIGGDMVGKNVLKYYDDNELSSIIDGLKIKKRYFVEGNHDDFSLSFYKNFNILNDETIYLSKNITLTGLKWEKEENVDYRLNRENYNILLSHYPDRIEEYCKINLGLGAHSHGLQVNVPFLRFHHKEKYTRGLYSLDNQRHLYVNKGLGFSLLKIRFLSCREIVKIELKGSANNGNS